MILITGATGLVGSHLALHLLENNEKLRAIYRSNDALKKTQTVFKYYNKEFLFEKIEWIRGDITDIPLMETAFQEIEFVYHCAALISFDPSDEKQIRKINIEGTANIVNLCLKYKIKKLCHISSIAALGNLKANEKTISEKTEWNPELYHSDYAISKYGAEIEVYRGQQEGLSTVIINPGVILGPSFWQTGSGIIYKINKRLRFFTKGRTAFVTVNDVVLIASTLMKSQIAGERFVVVSANINFETILKTIAGQSSVLVSAIEIKPWMMEVSWRIDWLMSNILGTKRNVTKSMALSLFATELFSNNKTKQTLNYQFENIEEYIKKQK